MSDKKMTYEQLQRLDNLSIEKIERLGEELRKKDETIEELKKALSKSQAGLQAFPAAPIVPAAPVVSTARTVFLTGFTTQAPFHEIFKKLSAWPILAVYRFVYHETSVRATPAYIVIFGNAKDAAAFVDQHPRRFTQIANQNVDIIYDQSARDLIPESIRATIDTDGVSRFVVIKGQLTGMAKANDITARDIFEVSKMEPGNSDKNRIVSMRKDQLANPVVMTVEFAGILDALEAARNMKVSEKFRQYFITFLKPAGTKTQEMQFKKGDWRCSHCRAHNYARNLGCIKCGKPKAPAPEGSSGPLQPQPAIALAPVVQANTGATNPITSQAEQEEPTGPPMSDLIDFESEDEDGGASLYPGGAGAAPREGQPGQGSDFISSIQKLVLSRSGPADDNDTQE